MPKDINFHKVNDITTDSVTKIDGNMNMYFQRDGRIFLDNLQGVPVEMKPEATTGRHGMVKTTKLLSDISNASESLVPTVSLLKVVYDEIMTPDRDTTFGGKVIINANKGLLFPETTQKTIPHGMNGMIGGPGQTDPLNASTNIYSQDKVFFSPSEEGGLIRPGQSALTVNVMTGDVSVAKNLYVGGSKVLTDKFAVKPEEIGAAPIVHKHSWLDITGVPGAGDTVAGIVKLTNSTTSNSQYHAASAFALDKARQDIDEKLDTSGGTMEGMINFSVGTQRKINFANNDYLAFDDSSNTFYFEADDDVNKATLKGGYTYATNYMIVGPEAKRIYLQANPPSGARAGDIWIQS